MGSGSTIAWLSGSSAGCSSDSCLRLVWSNSHRAVPRGGALQVGTGTLSVLVPPLLIYCFYCLFCVLCCIIYSTCCIVVVSCIAFYVLDSSDVSLWDSVYPHPAGLVCPPPACVVAEAERGGHLRHRDRRTISLLQPAAKTPARGFLLPGEKKFSRDIYFVFRVSWIVAIGYNCHN